MRLLKEKYVDGNGINRSLYEVECHVCKNVFKTFRAQNRDQRLCSDVCKHYVKPPSDMVPLKGFEGYFSINKSGQIWSHKRNSMLRAGRVKGGYLKYILTIKGERYHRSASRLVAKQFLPNFSKSIEVNHKDFDKTNNCISNLECISPIENKKHAYKNGRMKNAIKACGIASIKRRKLTRENIEFIRSKYSYRGKYNAFTLSKKFKVSISAVRNVINGVTYEKTI